jgi:hypothetical protein
MAETITRHSASGFHLDSTTHLSALSICRFNDRTESIDASDPKLAEAWKDCTNDKSPTNWILFGFKPNTEILEVVETGTTGLAGLRTKLKALSDRVLFGAVSIAALDKRASVTSKRPKFVAFSYVGGGCTEMQRANSSFQKNRVMQQFNVRNSHTDLSLCFSCPANNLLHSTCRAV